MTTLQDILISNRSNLKLSLRDAAQLIGISHSYLSILEKGLDPRTGSPINPTPETLRLISKAYNINYEELMIVSGYIQLSEPSDGKFVTAKDQDEPSDEYKVVDFDEIDGFLAEFRKKGEERGIDFDEDSIDDLLDLYEFIKKRDKR